MFCCAARPGIVPLQILHTPTLQRAVRHSPRPNARPRSIHTRCFLDWPFGGTHQETRHIVWRPLVAGVIWTDSGVNERRSAGARFIWPWWIALCATGERSLTLRIRPGRAEGFSCRYRLLIAGSLPYGASARSCQRWRTWHDQRCHAGGGYYTLGPGPSHSAENKRLSCDRLAGLFSISLFLHRRPLPIALGMSLLVHTLVRVFTLFYFCTLIQLTTCG